MSYEELFPLHAPVPILVQVLEDGPDLLPVDLLVLAPVLHLGHLHDELVQLVTRDGAALVLVHRREYILAKQMSFKVVLIVNFLGWVWLRMTFRHHTQAGLGSRRDIILTICTFHSFLKASGSMVTQCRSEIQVDCWRTKLFGNWHLLSAGLMVTRRRLPRYRTAARRHRISVYLL